MIVSAPSILSEEWMLIGRQERTSGGPLDLLAIAPDQNLVVIELKREKTPREVVAQALDYAAWADSLELEDIVAIYGRFQPQGDLATDFESHFGQPFDPETVNGAQQIVIVASAVDSSSERIVNYLSSWGLPINVLFFQVFEVSGQQLLSRAWLLDPIEAPAPSGGKKTRAKEPWNGEFYASFGEGITRSWDEAMRFGFISAGGGTWYSNTLRLLSPGDRVWVRVPKRGYVGVAQVLGSAVAADEFHILDENGTEHPAIQVLTSASYHRDQIGTDLSEYFVPVSWIRSVPIDAAIEETGFFGNQNSVCKPTTPGWRSTVDRLKLRWDIKD